MTSFQLLPKELQQKIKLKKTQNPEVASCSVLTTNQIIQTLGGEDSEMELSESESDQVSSQSSVSLYKEIPFSTASR